MAPVDPWIRSTTGSAPGSKQKQSNKIRKKILKPSTNGSMGQSNRSSQFNAESRKSHGSTAVSRRKVS